MRWKEAKSMLAYSSKKMDGNLKKQVEILPMAKQKAANLVCDRMIITTDERGLYGADGGKKVVSELFLNGWSCL